MAHESHAPDATFIVAEPDFVIYREDGDRHMMHVSEQEQHMSNFSRLEELGDLLSAEAKMQYLAELEEYRQQANKDNNAPWPVRRPAASSGGEPADDAPWTAEAYDSGFGLLYAFHPPRKPPAAGFKPSHIRRHLHDLQAYMTASA